MSAPWLADGEDDVDPDALIMTRVGYSMRPVTLDLFLRCHAEVADRMRAAGYVGEELDIAIVSRMPAALAALLDASSTSYH